MTRINLVPPQELHSKHLLAEYRELPRVFALAKAAHARGLRPSTLNAPQRYTMGTGHVKFFYDKLVFLANRQQALVEEMKHRGFSPKFSDAVQLLDGIDSSWLNDYHPDETALSLNRERIAARSPWLINP